MDYVIIGGGVYGCGVAWELARRGAEVLLLEANQIASGASGGLGKRGVRANGRDLRELPLMALAYDRWLYLHQELDGPTGYDRDGHLLLIEREQDRIAAPAQAWMQVQQGVPSEIIEEDALHEMEPYLSEQVVSAIYCPNDGVSDHTLTTRTFAEAARRFGADVREETRLHELKRQGDRITGIVTDKEEHIPVDKTLILLANSHVPVLLQKYFNLTLPIWQILPQVLLTEPVTPMPVEHLIGHAHRTLAMKAHTTSSSEQVMISGGWRGRWNPATGRGETQPDQIAGNLAEAVAVYPMLEDLKVWQADAGRLETVTVDGIPIIDRVAGVDNLFYATGWSGHGWAISPVVTRLLADWVWEGDRPELLAPFGYERFR
ncbi:MAG: FAD-binding oxidoreductase [Chloroflexota bacterium]